MMDAPDALRTAVLAEAMRGLALPQKQLAPWLFYDQAGSHLFDAITELPEYYLTRTERALLRKLGDRLPAELGAPVTIAELGAGSAGKTGILLEAFAAHQGRVLYQPIDISPTALKEAAESIENRIPQVSVEPQVANYITEPYRIERPGDAKVLALYIGSSIGNFAPEEQQGILANLRRHLEPGDWLLLGLDLAPGDTKVVDELIAAYDDEAGVTAAFNRNVLERLNRELGTDFNLECFAHRARWNEAESRMEMHLEALAPQVVHLDGERFSFARGETIHTENSYKFSHVRAQSLLESAGFAVESINRDDDERYAVILGRAV